MKEILASLVIIMWTLILPAHTESSPGNGKKVDIITAGKQLNDTTPVPHIDTAPFDLRIVPPSSGVRIYEGDVIFLSPVKNEKKMPASHLAFGNIQAYYASYNDSTTGPHHLFSPYSSTPFDFPSDAMTFSSDGKTMYFTRLAKSDGREKIYKANHYTAGNTRQGWSWDNQPLSFCTEGFRYTHPALSANGKILVFASDRSPSQGGMDLFMSRLENDQWSKPENLGSTINTAGNEMFPFFDKAGNLYYSSDALPGFGGYDIFICPFNGKSWSKPVNLSDRINTADDEIAFNIGTGADTSGFFTRRLVSRPGKMQLYLVRLPEMENRSPRGLSQAVYDMATGSEDRTMARINFIREENAKPAVSPVAQNAPAEHHPADNMRSEKETGTVKNNAGTETGKTTPPKPEPATSVQKEKPKAVSESTPQTQTAKTTTAAKPAGEVTAKPPAKQEPAAEKVVYRVQFASSVKPKSSYTITVNGKKYKTFQYLYKGAYRQCVGEFSTLEPAKNLQNACRRNGYPQAFVVVFVNNKRTVDAKYFK